ncbi:MAG: nitroreductase family protein [Anaerolineae bacterium]
MRRAIEKEKVLQLLDVARYAPNGANRQVIQWVVVNDPDKVHRMAEMTIEWMKVVQDKTPGTLRRKPNWNCLSKPWDLAARTASPRRRALRHHGLCAERGADCSSGGHDCHSPNSTGSAGARLGNHVYRQHQYCQLKAIRL